MPNAMPVTKTRLVAQIGGTYIVLGAVLFGAAGTLAWAGGWAFLLVFLVFSISISAWLMRHDPGLLAERVSGGGKRGQEGRGKLIHGLVGLLFLAWLALAGLDAVRFRWSHVPIWLRVLGGLALIASFHVHFLTFRENPFLSPAVRVQTERGHRVVTTGPYAHVRHPMYAATIVYVIGGTLLLGSAYGLLPALGLIAVIVIRAVREERVLRAELPGYAAYMAKVRNRFIPHVW